MGHVGKLYFGMRAPRTKPLEPKAQRAMCTVCAVSVSDLAAWGVEPEPKDTRRSASGSRGGRPRISLKTFNYVMQPIYFMGVWFDHLHRYCSSDPQGAERHLRQCGLADWAPVWRQAQ